MKAELLKKLEEYAQLQPCWDSYFSKPISTKAIESAKRIISDIETEVKPLFTPCTDGGLQLEWSNVDIEIEFTPEGKIILLVESEVKDERR